MTFLAVSTNKDVSLLPTLDIRTDPTSSADDGLPLKYVRKNCTLNYDVLLMEVPFQFSFYSLQLFLNNFFLKNLIVLLGTYVN